MTPDTAVRLAVYFGTSEEFWINLQAQYDARIARRDLRPVIEKQLEPHAA
jgi:addiction module HigA family antidote